MKIGKGERIGVPLVWAMLVPAGTLLLWQTGTGVGQAEWLNYLLMMVAAVVTGLFPLEFKNITVSFQGWVLLAIFLRFGAGPEVFAAQLVVLASIIFSKSSLPAIHRFSINSLIFFMSSICSAAVFFWAGGTTGSLDVSSVMGYGLLYMVVHLVTNHLCLFTDSKLFGRPYQFLSKETLWDGASLLFTFPVGVAAYFLDAAFGIAGLLPVFIPFLFTLVFAGRYNKSDRVHQRLELASQTGYELADRMNEEELVRMFIRKIHETQGADAVYLIESSEGRFHASGAWEEDHFTRRPRQFSIEGNTHLTGLERFKSGVFGTARDWKRGLPLSLPEGMESVMIAPLRSGGGLMGFVLAASYKKHEFDRQDAHIFHLLCTHFAVALEKARYVTSAVTNSMRCPLTGLYNYRWFERELERHVRNVGRGVMSRLSIIILDIDHFKSLNDTYGHQSGNDILISLGDILSKQTNGKGHIARFGGEEFVILLPGWKKDEATDFAEQLRCYIEQSVFEVSTDLGTERNTEFVSITASFGVASTADDSVEAMDLLRNADRALYKGGKQAGRNRVGVYSM